MSAPANAAGPHVGQAKLLLLLLTLTWGFNWTAARLALDEVPPWTLRFITLALAALFCFTVAALTRTPLKVPAGQRRHVMVAGFINVALFNIFATFAQMGEATSRVVFVVYSMPIWAALMARIVLGERLTPIRLIALLLCASGLTVLVSPLLEHGWPLGLLYAWGASLSYAAGAIYMKWARMTVPPIAAGAWQLLFGWMLIAIGTFIFDGTPHLWPLQPTTIAALAYNGLVGLGAGYVLWFAIIGRLPATTAALGSLLVPVIGATVSSFVLAEHPTATDIVGFVLIFAAAACVLLQPAPAQPKPDAQ